jgi:hypothetical protein
MVARCWPILCQLRAQRVVEDLAADVVEEHVHAVRAQLAGRVVRVVGRDHLSHAAAAHHVADGERRLDARAVDQVLAHDRRHRQVQRRPAPTGD